MSYTINYRHERDEIFSIETDRLRLSVLKKSAAPKVCDYYVRNKDFHKKWAQTQPDSYFSVKAQKEYLRSDSYLYYDDRLLPFFIFEKGDTQKIIGRVSLFNIVRGGMQSAALGYHQDEKACGKGYMTEAVQAITEYGFKELNLHRIEAFILPSNDSSLRLIRRSGFREEGLRKSYMHINGKWEDHLSFALFEENLKELKK